MDLSRLSITARTRSSWEAIDLGFVMVRAWWKPLFLTWFIPSFCLFLPLLVFAGDYNWLAWALVWWFKPLFDRGPLYVASRNLFGEPVGVTETLRELISLYKKQWLLWLTVRRFSLTRSFDMPLTVLEEISGERRSSRQSILHRGYGSAASWLTMVAVHLEAILAMGFYGMLMLLIPEQIDIDFWSLIVEEESMVTYVSAITTYSVMTLVGPFYAVAGFAMYISRRIELEAWDIEIRFRHIARKQEEKESALRILPVLLFIGFIGSTCLHPAEALAQASQYDESSVVDYEEYDYVDSDREQTASATEVIHNPEVGLPAKERIQTILAGDEFHNIETISGFRLKDVDSSEEVPDWLVSLIEFFENNAGFFKAISDVFVFLFSSIEYILIALVVFIIILVIIKYRNQIQQFWTTSNKSALEHEAPKVMFGLDVTRESLPDDVPSEALELWKKNQYRQSVSLLYRALLAELIHRHGFAFADSDTEGECVAKVRKRGESPLSQYSLALTGCWQNVAYGHVMPSKEEMETLCLRWREVFKDE